MFELLLVRRIMAVVPTPATRPSEFQETFGHPAGNEGQQPQPSYTIVEPALKAMAEAGALPLMVLPLRPTLQCSLLVPPAWASLLPCWEAGCLHCSRRLIHHAHAYFAFQRPHLLCIRQ